MKFLQQPIRSHLTLQGTLAKPPQSVMPQYEPTMTPNSHASFLLPTIVGIGPHTTISHFVGDLMKEAHAVLRFQFASLKRAFILSNALQPEIDDAPARRSKVEVKCDGEELVLIFRARDSTALRTSINSYTRWIAAIEDVLSRTESLGSS